MAVAATAILTATVPPGNLPWNGDKYITLSGTVDTSNGTIEWVCGGAGTGTTMETKYLPSTCRG